MSTKVTLSFILPQASDTFEMGIQASEKAYERNRLCRKVALAVFVGGLFIAGAGALMVIFGAAVPCVTVITPGALLFASALLVGSVVGLGGLDIANKVNGGRLHNAAMNGSMLTAKGLLFLGANPNSISLTDSMTPLHSACLAPPAEGQLEVIRLLLERGADINFPNNQNGEVQTPLHSAILQQKVEIVRLLVQQGAALDSETVTITPLQLAEDLKEKAVDKTALDAIIAILKEASKKTD